MQGDDSGASNECPANDAQAVIRPREMLRPDLRARVEQWECCTSLRINGLGLVALVPIANGASQPEVRLVVGPALCERDNVRDLQACHHQMLRAETVPATVLGCLTHAALDHDRDCVAHHCVSSAEAADHDRPQPSGLALCLPSRAGIYSSRFQGVHARRWSTYLHAGALIA